MEKSEKELEFTADPKPADGPAPINTFATLAICSGGWLIPGLSHLLLGKWIRGIIFSACVLLMFVLGLGMHGKLFGLAVEEPLQVFAFIANIGVGLPYLLAERMRVGTEVMTARTYDYGTTYLWVAGLLNYLIILDAFDIAKRRKP